MRVFVRVQSGQCAELAGTDLDRIERTVPKRAERRIGAGGRRRPCTTNKRSRRDGNPHRPRHRRIDITRVNRISADVAVGKLSRNRFGQQPDGALGRALGRKARRADHTVGRGDVGERTVAVAQQGHRLTIFSTHGGRHETARWRWVRVCQRTLSSHHNEMGCNLSEMLRNLATRER